MLSFLKKEEGFSLLEVSLVLAIMGTVAGLSLPLFIEHQKQQKIRTTQERLKNIKIATGIYAARHHKLPCPSPLPTSGIAGICSVSNLSSGTGYVPFKTLGLSEKSSLDGYGHPLRYAIDINTKNDTYNFDSPTPSTLHIENLNGTNLLDPHSTKDPLALVVFSEGTAYAKPQSNAERRNTAPTLEFVDAPFSQRNEAPFRHIMTWSTFSHLIVMHGKGSLPQKNTGNGGTTHFLRESQSNTQSTIQSTSPENVQGNSQANTPPARQNVSLFDNNDPGF